MNTRKQFFLFLITLLVASVLSTALADANNVITLNVTNTPIRGDVALEKTGLLLAGFRTETDAWGNSVSTPVYENGYLAGAVFELRAAEDVTGKDGTVHYRTGDLVETLTTSASGTVKSGLLPLGHYSLKEVSAPEGYVFDDTPFDFTLKAIDQKTAVVEIKVSASNAYLPIRVSLKKQKQAMKRNETDEGMIHQTVEIAPGEGFVFGLLNSEAISYGNGNTLPANTMVASGATDADGNLVFSGYFPHGSYYLKELSVPAGWKLDNQQHPVELTSRNKAAGENRIVVSLDQPILNELIYTPITLTKADITGAEKLPGAIIEVLDSTGTVIYREETDKNGEIADIPVVPGTYTFRETYAPEGYALNVAEKSFTVAEDGTVTGETEIQDDVTRVQLKKVDQENNPLPKAVFGLFDKEGNEIQEAMADETGLVTFSRFGYGEYTIRELSAPYGFHPSQEEWTIFVDGTWQNSSVLLATVINEEAPAWIRITKLDALDEQPIAGVQFDVFLRMEDGTAGDLITTMVTDETGLAVSEKLTVGDYIVAEHDNPVGYEPELRSETITLHMDETLERTVTNQPIQGRIEILKTDSETKRGLPGVEFTVTRISGIPTKNGAGDGEVVAVITTDENGIAETPLLTWGEYEVKETGVPEGYLDDGYRETVVIGGADK